MYNIQVPSLAAFPPAYKTLKAISNSQVEIQTIFLTEVDHMDEFFDLYRMEHRWLSEKQDPGIWDSTILSSKDYLESTRNHLLELTKSRFIPSDWPENLALLLQSLSQEELKHWARMDENKGEFFLTEKAKKLNSRIHETISSSTIIDDFYLLKNGDELGKRLIPADRLNFYEELIPLVSHKTANQEPSLNRDLILFFGIFEKLFYSNPSDHFSIDLKNNTIKKLEE